jgi:hypothetical protein
VHVATCTYLLTRVCEPVHVNMHGNKREKVGFKGRLIVGYSRILSLSLNDFLLESRLLVIILKIKRR